MPCEKVGHLTGRGASDRLTLNGADIRRERLDERRVKLSGLLARADGIRFSERRRWSADVRESVTPRAIERRLHDFIETAHDFSKPSISVRALGLSTVG